MSDPLRHSLITPLKENNYATWKIQIKMSLIKDDLWRIVSGTETAPAAPAELAKFNIRRDKALANIVLTVDPKLLYLLGDPSDPVAVYKKLEDIFQKKSWSNKFRLKKSLYNLKLNNNGNLQEHLKKLMEIFDELAVLGDGQKDEDKVICLLSSLPEKFDTLVTALEASENIPAWDVVVERLLHQDKKLSTNNDVAAGGVDNALMSRNRYDNKHQSYPKKKISCYECGAEGHIRKNCFKFIAKKKKSADGYSSNRHQSGDGYSSNRHQANNAHAQQSNEDFVMYANNYSAIKANDMSENIWLLDSGCTQHMSNERNLFSNFENLQTFSPVEIGDGTPLNATGRGDVILNMNLPRGRTRKVRLTGVLFVPDLNHNLISVSQCNANNRRTIFYENSCKIFSNDNCLIACGKKLGKLYVLDCVSKNLANAAIKGSEQNLWHRRLNHVSMHSLQKMTKNNLVNGLNCDVEIKSDDICEDCCQGKNHRTPFPKHVKGNPRKPLELIHSDLCGKISPPTKGGAAYFVTFIDDATKFCWVYCLKSKDETFDVFRKFKAEVENQFNAKIKIFRTDNGGEFCSNVFETFLESNGIIHQKTISKTPEQNGCAERRNRYLVETVRCMLSDAGLSKDYWGEAVSSANYIHNRCYTSCLHVTPFEALHGRRPSLQHVRVFGSKCFAHIPHDERTKLDNKSRTAILVGYGSNVKGYRLYDTDRKKIFYSRDVIFNENRRSNQKEQNNENEIASLNDKDNVLLPDVEYTEVEENNSSNGDNDSENEFFDADILNSPDSNLRRSNRVTRPPERLGEWCQVVTSLPEPANVTEALAGPEADLWLQAMNIEMDAMKANDVWQIEKRPYNTNIIKCKWIFKRKYDIDGNIISYKARLVGCGYSQKYGIDYAEVYSPVVRFESIRCIISLAAQNNLLIHAMDVSSAFLNSELSETLYMEQPENFECKDRKNFVCKLNKAIYGLKQSSKCWNSTFSSTLLKMNFKQSIHDSCVYTYFSNDILCIIGLYVDDLILACNSNDFLVNVKNKLQNVYKMKDLGEMKQFLGVNVHHKNDSIFLEQSNFTENLLAKFGFSDAKPVATPVDISQKLCKLKENDEKFDIDKYQSAVGALLFLSTRSRPDISFAVSNVAKYCTNPSKMHWQAVKRIFRYLKGTVKLGIAYSRRKTEYFGYSDADFAGDLDDRKSTSGYCFVFGDGAVSWKCSKQTCTSMSTAESEYVALSESCKEAVWLQNLLSDLHNCTNEPILIYEDNQSALCISKSNKGHGKTKHIQVKYHYIRDMINCNKVTVEYCPTEDMLADIFTKGLTAERFSRLRNLLGMKFL